MSTGARIVLLFTLVPLGVAFLWSLFRQSVVTITPGQLGLLAIKGRPTDRVLHPGPHWVPALRKRSVIPYPSVELAYRASEGAAVSFPEHLGPPLRVTLGDRAEAVIEYTVRFRLEQASLPKVHDRFGTEGLWSAVRDASARALNRELGAPDIGVEDMFGAARTALEDRLGAAVSTALAEEGFVMASFTLGGVDLGRAGALIQAAVRSRFELAREEAEAAIREARVRNDAALAPELAGVGETALRYRQADVWRDVVSGTEGWTLAVPSLADAGAPSNGSGSAAGGSPGAAGTSPSPEPRVDAGGESLA